MKIVVILDVKAVGGRRPAFDDVLTEIESHLEAASQVWVPTSQDEVECEMEVVGIGSSVAVALENEAIRRANKSALSDRRGTLLT